MKSFLNSVVNVNAEELSELKTAWKNAQLALIRANKQVKKTITHLTKQNAQVDPEERHGKVRPGCKTLNDLTAKEKVVELLSGGVELSLDELTTKFINSRQVFTNSLGVKSTVSQAVRELCSDKVVKRVSAGVYKLKGTK